MYPPNSDALIIHITGQSLQQNSRVQHMKMILPAILILFALCSPLAAQDLDRLKDLKRPRYGIVVSPPKEPEVQQKDPGQVTAKPDNSRFKGTFKGKVTVHYEGKMVHAEAILHILLEQDDAQSHYDRYIIPQEGSYQESTWKLDKSDVHRSVTISGRTIYVTDLIEYSRGGNSQIRTLIFSPDFSALTFLKTEFDDAATSPATGQIIGRFTRVE